MSHYPGAVWRPVAYQGLHARHPRKAALLHTNGGGAQLFGWWQQLAASSGNERHVGAQYQVFKDGRVECYVDPDLVVYHAYGASEWAIGIETEDDSKSFTPWTPAQIKSIAAILDFHDVPPQMLTSPNPADGVGYHQQFTEWNGSGHECPGSVRRGQIPDVIAAMNSRPTPAPTPAPSMKEWDEMATKEEIQAVVQAVVDQAVAKLHADHLVLLRGTQDGTHPNNLDNIGKAVGVKQ